MGRCSVISKVFAPGVKVAFVSPSEHERWFTDTAVGLVIDSRQYGQIEAMITAKFGSARVHISSKSLKIVVDS